ncbi:low-density lipoprotein receptor-related protein 4 isoform X2 [Leptopilina heterotoma]|uniref:low-density lipoprotein receptor-related protein 4 isoform X2 n=1 Tax=Leptopilina heterotoma TaxID=63436 RepID=UPI001CA8FC8E|nr:low-density lipoprotein receptor-related protein 4 isoform X2 [Leptopilina heterotoma]
MRSNPYDLSCRNFPTLFCIICALCAETSISVETSTHQTVNRGAARQIYGSGSLRQTGSSPILAGTTTTPSLPKGKEKEDNKNSIRQEDKHKAHEHRPEVEEYPYETHGGYGYGSAIGRTHQKTQSQLPPGFLENARSPIFPPDHTHSDDLPSFRNGAPVNGLGGHHPGRGGFYGPYGVGPGVGRGGIRGISYRGFDTGAYETGGYAEVDHSRVRSGLTRGGSGSMWDFNKRLGQDQKTLIQELEDESDMKDALSLSCAWLCNRDQFLCQNSCTCISLEARCDGQTDCDGSEDEIDCEDILELKTSNGTCYGERSILCPATGRCIAEHWLCDGDDDCGDFSDESHCGTVMNCTEDQFECRNGLCIQQSWRCDGDNDCKDFSDEDNCGGKRKCNDNEFSCMDGTCILNNYRCDGENDCADGSDELKCEIVEVNCKENEFKCTYPRCISQEYRCDGDDDCGDRSDEDNCENLVGVSCNANEFRCNSGKCISRTWVCDKEPDCQGKEDEDMCEHQTPKECSQEEFTCSTGSCVPRLWVCDGVPDCINGEDEQGCAVTCDATQYLCKNSQPGNDSHYVFHHYHRDCISVKHVCDGVPDCPERDDEMNCPQKRNCTTEDKCSQKCILTVDNKKACACEPGFILGANNLTCYDINECEFEKDPVCSQVCKNTIGSFVCSCLPGYVLRPDLRTCKALGANPTLLFANRVDIRQVSMTGPKYTSVLKGLHNAIALDYHYKRSTIYWSDVSMDVIQKVFVNGTGTEDVVRWGLQSTGGIAIDWIHDLLFWTDSGTRRVEVITLDTKVRHVLISNDIEKPRAIAVHPNFGYVYWTDWGLNPKIERANMDGSDRREVIKESIFWPNGLTIDYTTDRIYWTDAKHHAIESSHLDGSDRKKMMSKGLPHPFAITVFEDQLYWTDWHLKSISSANKASGRGFKTIHSGLRFPMDLHSYHPQRQPDYVNHCGKDNGKCSHMCLPNNTGYSCVCPVGLKINRDGKTCANVLDNILIFTRKKDLRIMPIEESARVYDNVIPVDHVQSAVGLTWDSDEDMIYWSDLDANTISRAFLNGTNQTAIISHNLESPAGLAIDWITRKIYWTDAGTKRIECANLDGTMRTLLIHEGHDKPRDIILDPTTGHMYWSDWGEKGKIEKASMDGTDRRVLFGTDLTWPNGLAIDFDKKRLYWTDAGTQKIEFSTLDGKGRTSLISSKEILLHPFGLVVHKDKIYWTDWNTKSIHRADKETGKNITTIISSISSLMDVRVFHRNRRRVSNPCKNNNGNCSHLCLLATNPKRYKCACPTGLVLGPDGTTCPDVPNKFLLMAHRVDIRIVSFDVNYVLDVVLPISNLKNASGVDVNLVNGEIYWTDPGEDVIKRTNFNGSFVETVINTGIDVADSLVVDSIGRKLYWTDAGLNSIEVCELDGRNRKVLIWSGLDNPRAMAIYYSAGLLFWSDWGHNARIERANMDGEKRMTVVTENLAWPNGLSIDIGKGKIYWNDAKKKVIESADLDGRNRKVLIEKAGHPYGLAVMGNTIYWSDWQEKAVLQTDKNNGSAKVFIDKIEGVMDLRAVVWSDLTQSENVCENNNGGCSHLCLRNPSGYSCACPTGININDDRKTCNVTPTNFLLFATRKTLERISLDTPEMRSVSLPIDEVHNAFSVDFHWQKKLIVYTDVHLRIIRTVNMFNLSDTKSIIFGSNMSAPFGVAVDWIADNLYWTDMKNSLIEVSKLDGSRRKKLLDNLKDPRSIALFPKEGYIFWTEWGDHPKIVRALLDGSMKKTIISSDLHFPNGLSIDYTHRKLYWADALKDRIEVSHLNGRFRVALIPDATNPFGLTQYGEHIYWADWSREIIEQADRVNGQNRIRFRHALGSVTDAKAVSADRQVGWNPCAIENGHCSHLCFYTRGSYKCACPNQPDSQPCFTSPLKEVPLRKPGTENDTNYDEIDDEEEEEELRKSDVVTKTSTRNHGDDKFKDHKFNREKSYSLKTVVITVVIMLSVTLAIVTLIIYLLCQRKTKQKKYLYVSRRNVLTFSNPNYNASSGEIGPSNQQQDKKSFIWKRLKYDKSQERVYEDNGQTSSPEVVSLIPPLATPSSSRAASVTPKESSPSMAHVTQHSDKKTKKSKIGCSLNTSYF